MTVGAGICVGDGKLTVLGNSVLHDIHDNIEVTPASGDGFINGAFIGVRSDQLGSRRVFPVGKLLYVFSILSLIMCYEFAFSLSFYFLGLWSYFSLVANSFFFWPQFSVFFPHFSWPKYEVSDFSSVLFRQKLKNIIFKNAVILLKDKNFMSI